LPMAGVSWEPVTLATHLRSISCACVRVSENQVAFVGRRKHTEDLPEGQVCVIVTMLSDGTLDEDVVPLPWEHDTVQDGMALHGGRVYMLLQPRKYESDGSLSRWYQSYFLNTGSVATLTLDTREVSVQPASEAPRAMYVNSLFTLGETWYIAGREQRKAGGYHNAIQTILTYHFPTNRWNRLRLPRRSVPDIEWSAVVGETAYLISPNPDASRMFTYAQHGGFCELEGEGPPSMEPDSHVTVLGSHIVCHVPDRDGRVSVHSYSTVSGDWTAHPATDQLSGYFIGQGIGSDAVLLINREEVDGGYTPSCRDAYILATVTPPPGDDTVSLTLE
ncbi:hypothetical protein KIPB_005259, partial [Kipferlia bialata]